MDNGTLTGILQAEIDDAIGMLDSETTEERAEALTTTCETLTATSKKVAARSLPARWQRL